jgi:hypothetical protein
LRPLLLIVILFLVGCASGLTTTPVAVPILPELTTAPVEVPTSAPTAERIALPTWIAPGAMVETQCEAANGGVRRALWKVTLSSANDTVADVGRGANLALDA